MTRWQRGVVRGHSKGTGTVSLARKSGGWGVLPLSQAAKEGRGQTRGLDAETRAGNTGIILWADTQRQHRGCQWLSQVPAAMAVIIRVACGRQQRRAGKSLGVGDRQTVRDSARPGCCSTASMSNPQPATKHAARRLHVWHACSRAWNKFFNSSAPQFLHCKMDNYLAMENFHKPSAQCWPGAGHLFILGVN